ncbi:hypothetical protein [Symbiopectobacterium purcellii]|uniref:hypothetical protein n=1 Tax=Symbiopectobacterium purcellii TaxID=2871826 RepID=UPI003F825E78
MSNNMYPYPHLDTSKYIYPNGNGDTIDKKLKDFSDNLSNLDYNSTKWKDILSSYSSSGVQLNHFSVAQAVETFLLSVIMGTITSAELAIPGGFLLLPVVTLVSNFIFNDLSTNKTKSQYALFVEQMGALIDDNNMNIIITHFSGIVNVQKDLWTYISNSAEPSTYDDNTIFEIKSKTDAYNAAVLSKLPSLLIKDVDKNVYPGIPLYAMALSFYIDTNLEYLSHGKDLKLSDSDIEKEFLTFMSDVQGLQETLANAYSDSCQNIGNTWKAVTRFSNNCYLGGISKLLVSLKNLQIFGYSEKKIKYRNSHEIYSSDNYYSYDEALSVFTADIASRISPANQIGMARYDTPNGCVSNTPTIGYISDRYSDAYDHEKTIEKGYKANVQYIDTSFEKADGSTDGVQVPSSFTSNMAYLDYDYSQRFTHGLPFYYWRDMTLTNLAGLNFVVGNTLSPTEKYTMAPPGYIITGFGAQDVTRQCSDYPHTDKYFLTNGGAIFRHWTSIETVAVIEDVNTGIELDFTYGFMCPEDNISEYIFTPDTLLGKTVIRALKANTLYFQTANNTGSYLNVKFVLLCCADDYTNPAAPFKLKLNGNDVTYTGNKFKSQYIIGTGSHKYGPAYYKPVFTQVLTPSH